MAQGEFTKEEAAQTERAVEEIFDALPKAKRREFMGHLNDVGLFLHAAKKAAPGPEPVDPATPAKKKPKR
jgi:hypothetical protein